MRMSELIEWLESHAFFEGDDTKLYVLESVEGEDFIRHIVHFDIVHDEKIIRLAGHTTFEHLDNNHQVMNALRMLMHDGHTDDLDMPIIDNYAIEMDGYGIIPDNIDNNQFYVCKK